MHHLFSDSSSSTFIRYSDRFQDVLHRALRDKNLNITLPLPTSTFQQPKPLKFNFVQIKSLGVGACSSVYLVIEQKTRILYALKIITKSALINQRQSIVQEIKIHFQLSHPNVISLYHAYNDSGSIKLILECSQSNLMSFLRDKGRISQKDASKIISQILQGLKYIHGKGVTHRDIKLQNILLSNGTIKICDFGLARKQKQFQSSDFVGTIDYLSPEIVREKSYSHKTDIWAVGVILWEMVKGEPFLGNTGKDSDKYTKLIEMDMENIEYGECSGEMERFFKKIFTPQIYRAEAEQLLNEEFIKKYEVKEELLRLD